MRHIIGPALILASLCVGQAGAVTSSYRTFADQPVADPFVLLVDDTRRALLSVDLSIPELMPQPSILDHLFTLPNIAIVILGATWLTLMRRRQGGQPQPQMTSAA
jgi:hypothetical protein